MYNRRVNFGLKIPNRFGKNVRKAHVCSALSQAVCCVMFDAVVYMKIF